MEDRELIEKVTEEIGEQISQYEGCYELNKRTHQHLLASAYAEFCSTLRQLKASLMGLEP